MQTVSRADDCCQYISAKAPRNVHRHPFEPMLARTVSSSSESYLCAAYQVSHTATLRGSSRRRRQLVRQKDSCQCAATSSTHRPSILVVCTKFCLSASPPFIHEYASFFLTPNKPPWLPCSPAPRRRCPSAPRSAPCNSTHTTLPLAPFQSMIALNSAKSASSYEADS